MVLTPFQNNRLCKLLEIPYPIIQAGMVWCSGWRLASAVSNVGGLGVIGAGSMYPDVLEKHLIKCKQATNKNFAVNLPLLYPDIEKHIALIDKYKVPIVITSAGNPSIWTKTLQDLGITVLHVVSSLKFALKAQNSGVNAIIGEGFEAGGHNGKDETTTLVLIRSLAGQLNIPIIAAGGIADGAGMLACMALGADGVQVGSRFVASEESSAHQAFKDALLQATEGDTRLTLKEIVPVRLLNNPFYQKVIKGMESGATVNELRELLGKGRAKKGMFEGDMEEGELEIGQVSANIDYLLPAAQIVNEILEDYFKLYQEIREGRNRFD